MGAMPAVSFECHVRLCSQVEHLPEILVKLLPRVEPVLFNEVMHMTSMC